MWNRLVRFSRRNRPVYRSIPTAAAARYGMIQRQEGKTTNPRGPLVRCLLEYPFSSSPRAPRSSPLSGKKRHLVQTITPVLGAIGHQQRVKAAAITNSDSLIPFTSTSLPIPLLLSSFLRCHPRFRSFFPPRSRSLSLFRPLSTVPPAQEPTLSLSVVPVFSAGPTNAVPIYIRPGAIVKVTLQPARPPPAKIPSSISGKLQSVDTASSKDFPYQPTLSKSSTLFLSARPSVCPLSRVHFPASPWLEPRLTPPPLGPVLS